jgi:histidine triad (HIT) family protein
MTCAFCTLPEIQERKIIENDFAWAFPTNIPITPGHTLVMPKRHVTRYEDLTSEEIKAVEDLRKKLIHALKNVFQAEGFNFAWNDAEIAGQSVPHFHLHIVPRKTGDTGVYKYEPREFIYRPGEREASPEAELKEVARIIRKAII